MVHHPQNDDHDVILDSINEGVFTIDLGWCITAFNAAAERTTGVSRQHAINRPCSEVFHANICEQNCALKRTFETGQPIVNVNAFTDAKRDKAGRFMLAQKGTIFLDEIGDISPAMQIRLLAASNGNGQTKSGVPLSVSGHAETRKK